jgi:hypothetical protein
VALPHRVFEPNTPLWYARDINLPADGWLEVNADDGAQVFVGATRLAQQRRWFRLPPRLSGLRPVIVRVLNNAMAGGLRQVTPHDASAAPPPVDAGPRLSHTIAHPESPAFRARMPKPDAPCRFTAWADSQGGWSTFDTLTTRMTAHRMDLSVGIGDLVNDGSDPAAWRGFAGPIGRLAAHGAVVPIVGNHDYDGYANDLTPRLYLDAFAPPEGRTWTAWSCGPARFVAVDLNAAFPVGIPPGSPQQVWLEREVRSPAWTEAAWRILVVHQPPWSRSWPGYEGDTSIRAIVEPLVSERGLDVVLAGHSHAYERFTRAIGGRDLRVFITGGAGGSLEPAESERASTDAWRIVVRHHFLRAEATASALVVEAVGAKGDVFDRTAASRTNVSPPTKP